MAYEESGDEVADMVVRQDTAFCAFEDLSRLLPEERTPTRIRVACETAYRRGFIQGGFATLRAMEADETEQTIHDWLMDLHINWRGKRHNGEAVPPRELV